jgi:methylamine---corrinoid protein Co-methyltransferase
MKNSTRLLDVLNRSLTGPLLEEELFNRQVTQGIRRVVKEYQIRVHPENIVNQDDELADRTWQAALDFLAACGVYCQSTGRVIFYSQRELLNALSAAPDQVWLGSGTDAVLERYRKVEDSLVPINMGSPIGSPISEELFVPLMQSYIQEPLVDVTCPASLMTVHGQDIRVGSPLEILAAWEEVDLMRMALARAGRPGMAWTGLMLSMSDAGQLSAVNPLGLKSSDMHTFGIISELKTNFEILNKLTHSIRMGGVVDPYANPIYGGLGGGIEGQAVLITAAMIALSAVFMAACCGSSPTHPFNFNDTGKEIMQASSLAFQALARNSHLLTNLTITPVGGPGTKTLLYETAAFTIMSTVSGISRLLGPRSATGAVAGHFSGLEAGFGGEMLRASARLDRGRAEELVQRAYACYADQLDKKPYGLPFQEVYDLQTIRPTRDWQKMVDETLEQLAQWGLPVE